MNKIAFDVKTGRGDIKVISIEYLFDPGFYEFYKNKVVVLNDKKFKVYHTTIEFANKIIYNGIKPQFMFFINYSDVSNDSSLNFTTCNGTTKILSKDSNAYIKKATAGLRLMTEYYTNAQNGKSKFSKFLTNTKVWLLNGGIPQILGISLLSKIFKVIGNTLHLFIE